MLQHLSPFFKPYKLKALKVYTSDNGLWNNQKSYRQVFDRYELDYIYAELSFHNKLFDIKDWVANLVLKCYRQEDDEKNALICELKYNKVIREADPIFYLREGWGHRTHGVFWREGTYCWEAYINDKLVKTAFFYVEESAQKFTNPDAYLTLEKANCYATNGEEEIDATMFEAQTTFARHETAYVHTQLAFKNNLPEKDWFGEVRIQYYTPNRRLGGIANYLIQVEREQQKIDLGVCWGNSTYGSWIEGRHTIEVSFLDQLIAVIPVDVTSFEAKKGEVTIFEPKAYWNRTVEEERLFHWKLQLAKGKLEEVLHELLYYAGKRQLTKQTKALVYWSAQAQAAENQTPEAQKSVYDALVEIVEEIGRQTLMST